MQRDEARTEDRPMQDGESLGATAITVLMTCHNRRERTLACLESLERQEGVGADRMRVVLVDDGCTDGTAEAVARRFPAVRVVRGDGSLYWCGGMRLAFRTARGEEATGAQPPAGYDLWLNDDVALEPAALRTLLDTAEALEERAIVAGACCDPATGAATYGGARRRGAWPPLRFAAVAPGNRPTPCETVNGNVVLVPRAVREAVGNFDGGFTHGVGDFDYGLRARRLGFECWLAPGFVGRCARNPVRGSMRDASLPLRQRLALARRPTSMAPAREWMRLARRHTGWRWPLFWAEIALSRGPLLGLVLWLSGERPEP